MLSLRDELRALPVLTAVPLDFDERKAPDSPQELFVDWFRHAVDAGETEPHAMTLSTVADEDRPDARVLLLKDLDEHGWWFATSSASAKGMQLSHRPSAALTFYWRLVGRQVRIRGHVVSASPEQAATDFRARGFDAKAVALASRVSEPLADRSECDGAVQDAQAALEVDPALVAEHWSLYVVQPDRVEFWQADSGRRHHRLLYTRNGPRWEQTLLWP